MKGLNFAHFLCLFLFLTLVNGDGGGSEQVVRGGYYPSWAGFPLSAIDTSLYTHIYYAFVAPNNVTYALEVSNSTAVALLNFTSTLHEKNPMVKVLLSIGGAEEGPVIFSNMSSNATTRKNFILSSIEIARNYGFDGLDLDWEFPQSPTDMENYGYLLDEWRTEVQKEAQQTYRPPLLLTAATYYAAVFTDVPRKYAVASLGKNLDLINAMCYDYHGSWDLSATGAHAALFDPNSNFSTNYGLNTWIWAGIPKSKLVMGLPIYGRSWKLKDPNVHGIGAPAVAVGPGTLGVVSYGKILHINRKYNATVYYDAQTVSMYSVAGRSWIGYDDTGSLVVKIGYARGLGLRGYFFWDISYDRKSKISKVGKSYSLLSGTYVVNDGIFSPYVTMLSCLPLF
ncbi:Glycoside hydrolase family 18, catalytic domain [Dillenia turbinata]|uniref:Glycoside hydrolase family 18, catalytic domain n=1 Tax=Dillenia turbinata TaxID=194707 RepID=A0AAN8W2V2_9MAGN